MSAMGVHVTVSHLYCGLKMVMEKSHNTKTNYCDVKVFDKVDRENPRITWSFVS